MCETRKIEGHILILILLEVFHLFREKKIFKTGTTFGMHKFSGLYTCKDIVWVKFFILFFIYLTVNYLF